MRHRAGNVVLFLFCAVCTAAAVAQERGAGGPERRQEGPAGRRILGDYSPPPLRSFDSRGDAALEGMIRDGKLRLTEEDAIRLALENNVDINVERYNPYFSMWEIHRGRAVLNPSVQVSSNLNRVVTPSSSVLQGGDTLLNLTTGYNLLVRKPFGYGTDVEFTFSTLRARSSSFFSSLNPSFTSALGVSFTQHLLRDFGSISRSRPIRIARNNLSSSEEEFVARTSGIVSNVLDTYWELVFAEEDIAVREASKKLAEVVLEQNRIQAEVGTMSQLDVVQAEAEVAARNEQLVVARHNRRITEDSLKKLISSRLDPGTIPADIEAVSRPAAPGPPPGDVLQSIQRALEIRPEVKQLRLELENRKINVEYTRNQLRPALDLVASYSQNGLGGLRILRDFSGGFTNSRVVGFEEGGFWDSLDGLFSRKFIGYTVGLTLRLPIGNDEAKANNAQARISYRQGEEQLQSLRQRIALEVREAHDRMEMDQARMEAAEVTVRYAERRLRGEQDKYSLGAGTTRFILEAQRDLQEAQSRLLRAKIDRIKSRVALEKAVGDTFSAHSIELKNVLRVFN